MAVGGLVGLAADHEQAEVPAPRAEPRHRVEERAEALDRRDPPDVEHHGPAVEPEGAPRRLPVARREQLGVDAARDHGDPPRVGAVVAAEVRALHDVGRHDPVGRPDDPLLRGDARRRLPLGRGRRDPVLQAPEGVEHLEHGRPPAPAQRQPRGAREPVVRMDQVVVAVGDPPRVRAAHEVVEVVDDALARHRGLGAGRQVDHPHARGERDHPRDRGVLGAREHVHQDAHAAELARELADVDVHPARLLAAERGQRAGVHAEHRDAEIHGDSGGAMRTRHTSSATGSNSYL